MTASSTLVGVFAIVENRYINRVIQRPPVDTRANERKRYDLSTQLIGNAKRSLIARLEAAPDPSDLPDSLGPTVWMTHWAGMFPAVVHPASPVGRPFGKRAIQSFKMAGPSCPVDGAVYAASTSHLIVSGVHNGVNVAAQLYLQVLL